MKVEQTENSIKLIAESLFEESCLDKIQKSAIKSVRFEGDWNGTGPLIINFLTDDDYYNHKR